MLYVCARIYNHVRRIMYALKGLWSVSFSSVDWCVLAFFVVFSLLNGKILCRSSWTIMHIWLKCSVLEWKHDHQKKKKNQRGIIKHLGVFIDFFESRKIFSSVKGEEGESTSCFSSLKLVQCVFLEFHPKSSHDFYPSTSWLSPFPSNFQPVLNKKKS